jgi:hypothetical protein
MLDVNGRITAFLIPKVGISPVSSIYPTPDPSKKPALDTPGAVVSLIRSIRPRLELSLTCAPDSRGYDDTAETSQFPEIAFESELEPPVAARRKRRDDVMLQWESESQSFDRNPPAVPLTAAEKRGRSETNGGSVKKFDAAGHMKKLALF